MKNLLCTFVLLFTVNASAAVHNYWIASSFCGEMSPHLGDLCIIEVASPVEHLQLVVDADFVWNQSSDEEEINSLDLVVEKKGLKALKKTELQAMRRFLKKGVKAYRIHESYLEFTQIQDDQD